MELVTLRESWSKQVDFQKCTRDFSLDVDANADRVTLLKSVLIADETGRTIFRKSEELSRFTWARKELVLESAQAESALLMFFAYEHHDNHSALHVGVNGHWVELPPGKEMQGWFLWRYLVIPMDWLHAGINQFVFHSDSPDYSSWAIGVENANLTGRSAKSVDQGLTWDYALQGYDFSLKGEYVVRLRLDCHNPLGTLTSPQVDLASLAGWHVAPEQLQGEGQLWWQGIEPPGTELKFEMRKGAAPLLVGPGSWSPWTRVSKGETIDLGEARFLQWRATLSTENPLVSPCLIKVELKAEVRHSSSGVRRITVLRSRNAEIALSSFPFTYQPLDEPKLQILREQEKLDALVADAPSEWDKFIRLREWTSKQWRDHHGVDPCPYDALVILDWKRRGRPQTQAGCMHYAAVFSQICLALGLQARLVVCSENVTLHEGGHFITEVWSNDYGKWIMMDPDLDVHFELNGEPLSALEIHQLWMAGKADKIAEIQGNSASAAQFAGQGLPWMKNGHFHYWGIVPRNSQLTAQMPYHIEHGQITYHQNYFVWWGDFILRELPHVDRFTSRPMDLYWTLNSVHLYLSEIKSGNLRVELETVTPNFAYFEARLNGQSWVSVPGSFDWNWLRDGNLLEVRSVNAYRWPGPVSLVEVGEN